MWIIVMDYGKWTITARFHIGMHNGHFYWEKRGFNKDYNIKESEFRNVIIARLDFLLKMYHYHYVYSSTHNGVFINK